MVFRVWLFLTEVDGQTRYVMDPSVKLWAGMYVTVFSHAVKARCQCCIAKKRVSLWYVCVLCLTPPTQTYAVNRKGGVVYLIDCTKSSIECIRVMESALCKHLTKHRLDVNHQQLEKKTLA